MGKKRKKSKDQKLHSNLRKVICEYFEGRGKKHLTDVALIKKLSFPEDHLLVVTKILDELVQEGLLKKDKNEYCPAKNQVPVIKGTIKMHPRGFGFVKAHKEHELLEEIFIPIGKCKGAVHGDTVEVEVLPDVSAKGPEGKVISIIERGQSHLGGVITNILSPSLAKARLPLMGETQQVLIDTADHIVQIGDRIVVEMIEWGEGVNKELTARLCHKLGNIDDPSIDVQAAIEEYAIRSDFPQEVLLEAEAFGDTIAPSAFCDRLDLRNLVCVTIDPDTAKDFDDAISLEKEGDTFRLGVHIADVTHYVKEGSPLDQEAYLRANSTYFPGYCVPMLPPALCDNLCSLKPQRNRLAATVFMDISANGDLLNYTIHRSVIRSKKRLTYHQARKILEGTLESPHRSLLLLMKELALALKEKRKQRGSLDLSLSETIVRIDEQGQPTGLHIEEYDVTHQMIEEFMLKANEVVATHLANKGSPIAYRVHDSPEEASIRDYIQLLHEFGIEAPENASPIELNKAIQTATGTPYGQYLAGQYIRKMKFAYYSPENTGHWGLSLSHYCHFTSPIRRYADLLVHRVLFGDDIPFAKVEEITEKCSEQERLSSKAEMGVLRLKKLRLLHKWKAEKPFHEYEAVLTSLKPSGLIAEVLHIGVEAFIHISDLGDDYFVYNEAKQTFTGRKSKKIYGKGQVLALFLKTIDLIEGKCSFSLIEGEDFADEASKKDQNPKKETKRPYSRPRFHKKTNGRKRKKSK